MSYGWLPADLQRRIREQAVKDALEGRLSIVGAALAWDVRRDDLERWVDDAKNASANGS